MLACVCLMSAFLQAGVVIYPDYHPAIERDDAYDVTVTQGAATCPLVVWNHCEKSVLLERTHGGDVNRRFCEFSFEGACVRVDIAVHEDVRCYKVFPARLGLRHAFRDGVVSVWLERPEYFGIQLNDSDKTILSVFADQPEHDAPREGSAGVMYVKGWVDAPCTDGVIETGDDVKEIYLSPGSVLNARLKVHGKGTRLHGRGMVLDPMSDVFRYDQRKNTTRGVVVFSGAGCSADGVKLVDGRTFNFLGWAPDLHYTNVKILSSMMCSDGFTNGGTGLLIDHAWVYCGDNALVVGGVKDAVYRNVAIGTSCNAIFPQMSNVGVVLEDVDVFRADEGLINNTYNGVLRRNNKWSEMTSAVEAREPGPQDLVQRRNDFLFRNLSAIDCTLFSWLFRGCNTGTLPKKFVFDQLSIPWAAGWGNWRRIGKTNGVQVAVTNDIKRYLFTSNYVVAVTNLFLGGQKVDFFPGYAVQGTSDELKVDVTNDGTKRRVPLTADRTDVEWKCPPERRRNVTWTASNLLEDNFATRSIWQRHPSWLVKFDATSRDDSGNVIYRLTQCEKDAGLQAVITERFLSSGRGRYRLSFDCKARSSNPFDLEVSGTSNERSVRTRIPNVRRDGAWHPYAVTLDFLFDDPSFDLLSLSVKSLAAADEICYRNFKLLKEVK